MPIGRYGILRGPFEAQTIYICISKYNRPIKMEEIERDKGKRKENLCGRTFSSLSKSLPLSYPPPSALFALSLSISIPLLLRYLQKAHLLYLISFYSGSHLPICLQSKKRVVVLDHFLI